MTSHRFVDVSLSNRRSQWHSYDITESVVNCRHDKKDGDHLLGVTLEIKRAKGSYRIAPFRRLLKHNSQPFVLIFSDDGNNRTRGAPKTSSQNGIQDLLRSKVEQDLSSPVDYFSDQDYSTEESSIKDRGKRSVGDDNNVLTLTQIKIKLLQDELADIMMSLNSEILKNISTHKVLSSNIDDTKILLSKILNSSKTNDLKSLLGGDSSNTSFRNRIHKAISNALSVANASGNADLKNIFKVLEDNILYVDRQWESLMYSNLHKNIKLEQSRTKRRTSSKESAEQSKERTAAVHQSVEVKLELKSDDKNSRRRDRKRDRTSSRRRLKMTKKRRHRKLPFWWTRHVNKFHSKDHKNMCQRKSLVVDFVKLGWGDWVMSPKTFNAYYCSGGCKFPLTKVSLKVFNTFT